MNKMCTKYKINKRERERGDREKTRNKPISYGLYTKWLWSVFEFGMCEPGFTLAWDVIPSSIFVCCTYTLGFNFGINFSSSHFIRIGLCRQWSSVDRLVGRWVDQFNLAIRFFVACSI